MCKFPLLRWLQCNYGFLDGSVVKNLPAVQETLVWSLDQEDHLEKGMATHFSILAWRIPWTEEPGELQSIGSQRVGLDWGDGAHIDTMQLQFNFIKYKTAAAAAAAAAKSLQSCPTLCDPIDGSSPGSPIPGILQARTLEWVAMSFSNAWKWKVKTTN